MKRILYLIAAAALLMPVACEPVDKPDSGSDIELPEPATREVAKLIEFSAHERLTIDGPAGEKPKTIYAVELTDANRAIITTAAPGLDLSTSGTKAVATKKYEVRKFAAKDSKTFEVAGIGTISTPGTDNKTVIVKVNRSLMVKTADGETFETRNAIIRNAAKIADRYLKNAARSWKVNSTILEVRTKDSAIKETFSGGCDLSKMAKFAADHGVDALKNKLPQFDGYVVDEVLISSNGTICISFTGADPFAGSVNMRADGTFTFNFDEGGNSFFNASGGGKVEFTKDGKMNVSINSSIEGYSGTLKLNCSEVK